MKTGVKLTLGFSFTVLAMLITVVLCLNTSEKIHEEFKLLKEDIIPSAIARADMAHCADKIHLCMEHIIAGEYWQEELQSTMRLLEKAGMEHLEHEKHIGLEEKKTAEELLVKIKRVNSAAMEIINLKDQGRSVDELTSKEDEEFRPAMAALLKQLNEHKATHMEELAAAEEAVHHAHTSGKRIALLVSAIVAFLAAVIAFATTRSITKPLVALHRGTEIIGSGKLDYKVATDAKDEIGQLSRAFDKMTVDLRKTTVSVDELNAANQQLQASEQQLKAANQQLTANEQHLKAVNQQLESEIAERKKAKEALEASNRDLKQAASKLEELNSELKDFVYIASHDLREPMRKISSFGELLSASLKDKLNDDDKENLGFMVEGATRMQQMIDALLTYSRVTTRGVDFEPVDLNKVAEELCTVELAVKIEEIGAKIMTPERLHNVNCDPAQIRQLMQNLIANGLKYQKEGVVPEITIRSSVADNGMVRVEVADNGIGIKEEQFENVFVMFKRLHSRREYEGAGIGLAVCKKIVERHGGDIGVSSTYSEGTTFWFTMPVSRTPEKRQMELVSSSKAGFEG